METIAKFLKVCGLVAAVSLFIALFAISSPPTNAQSYNEPLPLSTNGVLTLIPSIAAGATNSPPAAIFGTQTSKDVAFELDFTLPTNSVGWLEADIAESIDGSIFETTPSKLLRFSVSGKGAFVLMTNWSQGAYTAFQVVRLISGFSNDLDTNGVVTVYRPMSNVVAKAGKKL
jgi:hypothetical protein